MGFFKNLFGKKTDDFYAPMAGKAVPISEVPDPTFAEGMLGNGIAIEPSEGKVYAPCDATVDMMFTTGHAVSLVADCGAEVLIHVGINTVELGGKYYTAKVSNGQKIKKGDLLLEFDMDEIREYRSSEMMGNTFRKVESYAELLNSTIREPFLRDGQE